MANQSPPNNPDHTATQLTREVIQACTQTHGFALAGVCSVKPSVFANEYYDWLANLKHGSMEYLERNIDVRLDPARILEGAKSAGVVGDLYANRASNQDPPSEPGRGRIARYARGKDYHKSMKKRLHALADALGQANPGHEFRAAVDTAPVLERELASRAGIGWTGKHTLVIHPKEGSYMLLGVLFTTLELEPQTDPVVDHCGTCTRCIEACPTEAITPYSVDGARCISYLTIEHRGMIDTALHAGIQDWVFGCDICQDVCPHNSPREDHQTQINEAYTPRRSDFDLLEILSWNEDARREAFTSSSMKRATLAMMKRNAIIVLGNLANGQPHTEVLGRLREIAADESEPEIVRDTATEVIQTTESKP